ncbi:MAG: CBS domain-containing protein [Eubacteriales bacterium]|nr:CBS domain-containing protein [Eubacteriales bacterium]
MAGIFCTTSERHNDYMNILFFLTPKSEVAYVYSSDTIGEAIEKLLLYRFTTVPVLNSSTGQYEGTLATDDLLRELHRHTHLTVAEVSDRPLRSIKRRRDYVAVNANARIENLLETASRQNFVPVVDDTGAFIGIVTRREVMKYLTDHNKL